MNCFGKKAKSGMACKEEDNNLCDPNPPDKELKSIYTAEQTRNGTKKSTFSDQYQSPKLTQQANSSANLRSCECTPLPLYYSSPRDTGPPPCVNPYSYKNIPSPVPPCMPNDDLWNLQFCRWWGWNWIRKREEELMGRQRVSSETYRNKKPSKRSRSNSRKRKKPPKKDDFFSWCRKLCRGGHKHSQLKLKEGEKQQLKQLYATPCSSVVCPCGLEGLENPSLHCVGEYSCSCSSTKKICTPVKVIRSKTRREECKCNIRKHQSWVCEKAETSSSDECCPCISACPRMTSSSSAEESIEYLSLRMERIKSDCEDYKKCNYRKKGHIKECSNYPYCSCRTEQNKCTCRSSQDRVCSKPSPCKCLSPSRIPQFRRYLHPLNYQESYKCQRCRKHVHPCVHRMPKCFPKPCKPVRCCQKKKDYKDYVIYCTCQEPRRKKHRLNKSKIGKVVVKTSGTPKGNLDCKTNAESINKDKETIDKCVGEPCDVLNANSAACNCKCPCYKCNPYIVCLNNATVGNESPKSNFIHRKPVAGDAYASPASGRIYSLNPKIFINKPLLQKSHLPDPINFSDKTFTRSIDSSMLMKAHQEHNLLLNAVCEALLTSRASDNENSSAAVNKSLSSCEDFIVHKDIGFDKFPKALLISDDDQIPSCIKSESVNGCSRKEMNTINSKIDNNLSYAVYNLHKNNITESDSAPATALPLVDLNSECKQNNLISTVLKKLHVPTKRKQSCQKNSFPKTMLLQGTSAHLPSLTEENCIKDVNIISSAKANVKNCLKNTNITVYPSNDRMAEEPWKEGIEKKSILNNFKNKNMPKSVFSHSTPICTPETYMKPFLNPLNRCLNLFNPENIFLDTSFNLPQNLTNVSRMPNMRNTSLVPAVSEGCLEELPQRRTTEDCRYEHCYNKNTIGEGCKNDIQPFPKKHLYNVLFSTMDSTLDDDFPSSCYSSRFDTPSAVVEELPPPDIHEQTQTSGFLLQQPTLICQNDPEKTLRSINLHRKCQFQACSSKQSAMSDMQRDENLQNVSLLNTQSKDENIKRNVIEKELQSVTFNQPGCDFNQSVSDSRNVSVDMASANTLEKELQSITFNQSTFDFHPSIVSNSANDSVIVLPDRSDTNNQNLENSKIHALHIEDDEQLYRPCLSTIPYHFHHLPTTNEHCTDEKISLKQPEKDISFKLNDDHVHNVYLPPVVEGNKDNNTSQMSLSKFPDNLKEEETHTEIDSIFGTSGDAEDVLTVVNKASQGYINDLSFISKNLPSYTSISDTSSIRSSLKTSTRTNRYQCTTCPSTKKMQQLQPIMVNSSTSPLDLPFQPQITKFLKDSSTSPFNLSFERSTVSYMTPTYTSSKFEYVRARKEDKDVVDNIKRKMLKHESPFSMFCVPVEPRNAAGPSTRESNRSLSRPERKIVVNKPNRLKIREKRWPF